MAPRLKPVPRMHFRIVLSCIRAVVWMASISFSSFFIVWLPVLVVETHNHVEPNLNKLMTNILRRGFKMLEKIEAFWGVTGEICA